MVIELEMHGQMYSCQVTRSGRDTHDLQASLSRLTVSSKVCPAETVCSTYAGHSCQLKSKVKG